MHQIAVETGRSPRSVGWSQLIQRWPPPSNPMTPPLKSNFWIRSVRIRAEVSLRSFVDDRFGINHTTLYPDASRFCASYVGELRNQLRTGEFAIINVLIRRIRAYTISKLQRAGRAIVACQCIEDT